MPAGSEIAMPGDCLQAEAVTPARHRPVAAVTAADLDALTRILRSPMPAAAGLSRTPT
ncbi:MAG: hypothetical protein H7A18_00325 [Sinobacteraceae bacterium]|nr:hypothetical protein [Nevskiaceae bacterium]